MPNTYHEVLAEVRRHEGISPTMAGQAWLRRQLLSPPRNAEERNAAALTAPWNESAEIVDDTRHRRNWWNVDNLPRERR
jgi:hypothetical protein